jgi:exopolysaccharide biosynthesis polyprenyl glycosylphosphotransferase
VPLDAVAVILAFVSAYLLRSNATYPPVVYVWPFEEYFRLALFMVPIWVIAFALAGLYNPKRQAMKELGQIIVGASLGTMAVVLWVFLNRSDFFSRLIVFYIWIAAIVIVGILRLIMGLIHTNLYLFGLPKRKLVIIGNSDNTTDYLVTEIKSKPALGYEIVGIAATHENHLPEGIKYLGSPEELEKILTKNGVDEVILTTKGIADEQLFDFMRACQEKRVAFKAVPTHAEVGARTLRFDDFAGVPVIEFKGTSLESWGMVYKRIIDIVGATIAMIVFSPLLMLISLMVKLNSKGPVIYKNVRVGNRGNFKTLKFRTMRIEHCTGAQYGGSRAESYENKLIQEKNIKKGSAVYKIAGDPRITSVGEFLRRTSLDELPQFINVLLGNMSLVGPRPHQPKEVQNYTSEQRKLLMIKPGITGLAQISGRSDLTFDEEARLDIFYLENWSIWLDLFIIVRTFAAVFKGKGSY